MTRRSLKWSRATHLWSGGRDKVVVGVGGRGGKGGGGGGVGGGGGDIGTDNEIRNEKVSTGSIYDTSLPRVRGVGCSGSE